jgi:predicted outer membrane protein
MTKSMSRREAGALALVATLTGGAGAAQAQMAPGMGRGPMSHGMASLTRGDQRYVMDTMRAGSAALRTSQLALRQAAMPMVRQFAEFEVREQTGISQILMDMAGPMAPPPPDPRMAAMEAQLMRMRGPVFDRMYVQAQVEGHQMLLRIQEDYLRGGRNQHVRHIATLSRGQILDHLTVLRHLQSMR